MKIKDLMEKVSQDAICWKCLGTLERFNHI